MNEFLYHILSIIHAYNTGISRFWAYARLRSKDVTPVICPTSIERCDSGRKVRLRSYPWLHTLVRRCNSGRMPYSGRKTQLWSYTRLQSYARLWSYAWLRSEDVAPVVCLTPVGRCDSGHMRESSCMLDSDRKMRLRSYVWLWSHIMTPVAHHSSDPISYIISYLFVCERFCMIELDDCNIL
jgi:hypothetical protein